MKNEFRKEFVEVLSNIPDIETAEGFLENMFTESEIDEFVLRLQIFKKLKEGKSLREISNELNVSITTVSRGSKEFKYNHTKFLETL